MIVPRSITDSKGTKTYPSIQIIFGLKDLTLALIIRSLIGDGSINKKKGKGAYLLTINSKSGILKIIHLI
ncbi:LAGLIDADG family homing endonuclease, partial [Enterococcus faecalis]|uniref:LAGLIDADG family homing endonuclease n=1 Tax=Enterococcus faecalis TaxID=1351 RepID=UPI003D6BCDCA